MNFQLTTYGQALFESLSLPPILDLYVLGTGVNYIPTATDTNIHGTQVGPVGGRPSNPVVASANLVIYSIYLDASVPEFSFGEAGLFYLGNLVALGANTELIDKGQNITTVNETIRIDIQLTPSGVNYAASGDLAESSNQFQVSRLSSPDVMPTSASAVPNMYVIQGVDATQASFLAYTDRQGLWNFNYYPYASNNEATVIGFDSMSVTISAADHSQAMDPTYFGEIILEFSSGALYSTCRYVKSSLPSGGTYVLGFNTGLEKAPAIGDKVRVFKRSAATAGLQLPIATASTLGGIKIGTGLLVSADGTCTVDPSIFGTVLKVNGIGPDGSGNVVLTAANITGLAAVARSGLYSDLVGAPPQYVLPAMSLTVRGGARLGPSGNLAITNGDVLDLSFTPVKTVNNVGPNASGNVTLISTDIGLINPVALSAGDDLNLRTTTGLFFCTLAIGATLLNGPETSAAATLEIVPLSVSGTGDVVQRWTSTSAQFWRKLTGAVWGSWNQIETSAIATTTTLGIIKVGSGLAITADGTLSNSYLLPISGPTTLGGVKPGTGLSVDGSGVMSLDLPIATTSVLGAVKIGSGISVTSDGTISVSTSLPIASASILGGIKVGSGLAITGDGTLSSIYSLPIASASILGGIKIGSGLSITGDGTVSASYNLPIASSTILGGIKIGAGLAVAGDGTVSVTSTYTLVKATTTTLGGVIVGSGLAVDASGTISVTSTYTLPTASSSILGGVKVGSGLAVAGDGTLSVNQAIATTTSLGVVRIGNGLAIDGTGLLTVTSSYTLPTASSTVLGGIKIGSGLSIDGSGIVSVTSTYSLPISSSTVLGGIKIGSGLAVSGDGTVSVTSTYTLPAATTTTLGGVIVGSGLAVTGGGILSATYSLPIATASILGGIKVGSGLSIAGDGTLTANPGGYTLPAATTSVLGGVIVGSGLSVNGSGVISVTSTYTLPIASASTLGGVKVGTGLAIDGSGVLSVTSTYSLPIASSTVLGGIKIGSGLTIAGDGTVNATAVADATKLNVVNGTAQGLALLGNALATVTTALTASVASANFQTATFSGGAAVTWSLTGWPATGNYAELEFQLTNAGTAASHTFPAAVNWVNPDGTLTTNFQVYMTNKRGTGVTNFQTSGTDFVIFWSSTAGSTIYAKVM